MTGDWFVHYTASGTRCVAGPYRAEEILDAKQNIARSPGNEDVYVSDLNSNKDVYEETHP